MNEGKAFGQAMLVTMVEQCCGQCQHVDHFKKVLELLIDDPVCIVDGCEKEAEFVSPADLCTTHWNDWFHHRIEIQEGKAVKAEQ